MTRNEMVEIIKKRPIITGLCIVFMLFILMGIFGCFHSKLIKMNAWKAAGKTRPNLSVVAPKPTQVYLEGNISRKSTPDSIKVVLENVQILKDTPEELEKLITISPELRGKWNYSYYNKTIAFIPEKEWLPNTKYKIIFDKSLFDPQNMPSNRTVNVTLPDNAVTVNDFSVWHDPIDAKRFGISANIKFDFPVEDNNLKIKMVLDGKEVPLSITRDQYFYFAFVKFDQLEILQKTQLAKIYVSLNGKKYEEVGSLVVPQQSGFFVLKDVVSTIIGEGEQASQGLVFNFSDPVSPEEVLKYVQVFLLPSRKEEDSKWNIHEARKELSSASMLKLTPLPQSAEAKEASFSYEVNIPDNEERYLYVNLRAGVPSKSGFIVPKDQENVLKVAQFEKLLKISGKGSILALSGSRTLNVESRGVGTVNVEIARVIPDKLNLLISQIYGNVFSQGREIEFAGRLTKEDLTDIYTSNLYLTKSNKMNYSAINLGKYLKRGQLGVFLVKLHEKDTYGSDYERLVLLTDIILMYKKDVEGTLHVFAVSSTTGKPIHNAKVEVLARNGTVDTVKYTNEAGVAKFDNLESFTREKEPTAFVVMTDNDYSFLPLQQGYVNYYRFDTDGQNSWIYDEGGLDGFIFTDRGIYRPGETVDFAIIAKNKYWTTTAGLPVKVKVSDPDYKTVFEKKISLTAEGLSTFKYSLSPSAPTGIYTIDLYNVQNPNQERYFATASFKVEDFKEQTLDIKSSLEGDSNRGWYTSVHLTGKVQLNNLYGLPAQGNEVNASLLLRPYSFSFSEYPDYQFSDIIRDNQSNIAQQENKLRSEVTSDTGEVSFDIDLSQYVSGTYNLLFTAEGFEQESGNSVKSRTSHLVSPNPYIIGYKSTADLSFIKKDTEAVLKLIAINPNLEKIKLSNLKASIISKQYVSVPVKQYNGEYRYQSVLQKKLIETKPLEILEKDTAFVLPTEKPGEYTLEITDQLSQKLLHLDFLVAGNANVGYSLNKDANLFISLAQKEVKPGENLILNITAPYTGTGLITIERDKVYAYKWFYTNTTSSTQQIQVPTNLVGGAYVNVALLRGADSKEVLISPHSYSLAYFKINSDSKDIGANIVVPTSVRPGEDLHIKYSTKQPAKMVLFGVNEGILRVAGYKTPNPLKYFLRKFGFEIETYQTWDAMLPDLKLLKEVAGIGGDYSAQENLLEAGLNPFARKSSQPVAFWSGVLSADTQTKTYTYKVPDYFNGKMRIMAVALNEQYMGATEKMLTVISEIPLSVGAPVAVAPKDEFEVVAKVANNISDKVNGKMLVSLITSDNLKITSEAKQEIEIAKGEEKTIHFSLVALDKLGNADITVKVVHLATQKEVEAKTSLSVRPTTAYHVFLNSDTTNSKSFSIKQTEKLDFYPEFESNKLVLSQNPMAIALGLEAYLEEFPYGCTEQIISQSYPTVLLGTTKKGKEVFSRVVDALQVRQLADGSLSLWDGQEETAIYPTLYALQFFTDAQDMGYVVPPALLKGLLSWANNFIVEETTSLSQAKKQAYAHYLLARNAVITTDYLSLLEEYLGKNNSKWKEEITGAYVASTYALLQDTEHADGIIKSYNLKAKPYESYSSYESQKLDNLTYAYLIGHHFQNLASKNSNLQLVKDIMQSIADKDYNTLVSAKSILVLRAYSQLEANNPSAIEAKVDDVPLKLTLNKEYAYEANLPGKFEKIEVNSSTDNLFGTFYTTIHKGFLKDSLIPSNNGIAIEKVLLDKDSKKVDTVTVGDEITVRITLKSLLGKNIENIAITDLLPGGFSIVADSTTGDYSSINAREDRMIIHTVATSEEKVLTYTLKATNVGKYTLPAVLASSLYDLAVNATSAEGSIVVKPRE